MIPAHAASSSLVSFDFAFLGAMLVMTLGCWFELKTRRFPNWLSLPLLLIVTGWRFLTSQPLHWLALFGLVWGYFFWAWRRGFLGAGDAKGLMILSGLWPTWQIMLAFLVWLAVTLLIYGLGMILFHNRGNPGKTGARLRTLYAHYLSKETALPKREVLLVPAVVGTIIFCLVLGRAWLG